MTSPNASASRCRPGSEGLRGGATWLCALLALLAAGGAAAQAPVPRPSVPLIPAPPAASAPSGPAVMPQAAPFVIISQERILTGSRTGQALLAEEEAQRDALRREARALDSAFEAEEQRLTDQRPSLPPTEFRALSDSFDARVVQARRDQDARAAALAQEFDQRRRQFYASVAPVLVMLMDRTGARAILDENSVLLADQSLNITDAVIAEIDAQAAEAPAAEETPPAPAEPAAPETGTPEGD
jgi:Skp family chaperone for outer membrane proteins